MYIKRTTTKEKPVQAVTITRASQNQQDNNTLPEDECQCPRCGLTGPADMFVKGWVKSLSEMIARNPGLTSIYWINRRSVNLRSPEITPPNSPGDSTDP